MPILDAGMFVILLGVAFGSVFMNGVVKNGFVFKLVGAFLFFSLGIMMNAEYEVAYTVITDVPGTGTITEYRYIVGDGSGTSTTSSWLGWLFIGLALIWTGLFFMEVMNMHGWGL